MNKSKIQIQSKKIMKMNSMKVKFRTKSNKEIMIISKMRNRTFHKTKSKMESNNSKKLLQIMKVSVKMKQLMEFTIVKNVYN